MRIAIDATRAVNEKAGVGRFTKELIENLLEIDKKNEYILLFNFWRNFKEKSKEAQKFKRENSEIKISRLPGRIKEGLLSGPIGYVERMKVEADIFLAPTFLDCDLHLKIPQIVIIHDLTVFRFPEHLGMNLSRRYQKINKQVLEKAFKVIAISESTKKDLIDLLDVPAAKIKVIYPGLFQFRPQKSLPLDLKNKSYILNVGTVEPRKNLEILLEGYALLSNHLREQFPLVVVGASGWKNAPIYKKWQNLNLQDRVIFTGFLKDEELASLYQHASCFVYPSIYEGFGLPVLEALDFGVPVITSKVSSLPEAGGKAVIYIDPKKPEEIGRNLKKILTIPKLTYKYQKLGKIQAQKFTWKKTAAEFIKVFKSATI